MIKGNAGEFLVVCDVEDCGVGEEGDHNTFKEFVDWIKSRGWKITKLETGWHHQCPGHK